MPGSNGPGGALSVHTWPGRRATTMMDPAVAPRTLFQRIWDDHVIREFGGGDALLHVAVGLAFVVSVGSLFAVSPLITLARHAASALPF